MFPDDGDRVGIYTDAQLSVLSQTTCARCGATLASGGMCPSCLLEAELPPLVLANDLELFDELGRGGMSCVFRAQDHTRSETVAVKVLPERLAKQSGPRRRFEREARVLALLRHPNIVAIHRFGEADGEAYIVMELVDGDPLSRCIPMPEHEAIRVAIEVCKGLEYAHAQGVVHRDIKPSNVLVDRRGVVKIADFGLARMFVADDAQWTITQSNVSAGTPYYMAPEQLNRGTSPDPRMDIYSLGVVLYEAITGRLPTGTFEPLQGSIDDVVRKALQSDPDLRYQNAHALRHALEDCLRASDGGSTGEVAQRGPTDNRKQTRSTRRTALIAACAAGIAFVGAGAAVWYRGSDDACQQRSASQADSVWHESRRQKIRSGFAATQLPYAEATVATVERALDSYMQQWVQANASACQRFEDNAVPLEFHLRERLCMSDRFVVVAAVVESMTNPNAALVQRATEVVHRLAPIDECSDLELLNDWRLSPLDDQQIVEIEQAQRHVEQSRSLQATGHFDESRAAAKDAVNFATTVGYAPTEAGARMALAKSYELLGAYDKAHGELESVVELARNNALHNLEARAWSRRVWIAGAKQNEYQTAKQLLDEAEQANRRIGSKTVRARQQSMLLGQRGLITHGLGDLETSLTAYRAALQLHRDTVPVETMRAGYLWNATGYVLMSQGQFDQALEAYAAAIGVKTRVAGATHPSVATTLLRTADTHAARHDYEQALEVCEQALQIRRDALGDGHRRTAEALLRTGDAHAALAQYDRAASRFQEALQIQQAVAKASAGTAGTLLHIARLHHQRGEVEQALARVEQSRTTYAEVAGTDHPSYAAALTLEADIWRGDDPTRARTLYGEALSILDRGRPGAHPHHAVALTGMAAILGQEGRTEQSVELLQDALNLHTPLAATTGQLAQTQFLLAQALMPTDRERAMVLGRNARDLLVRRGQASQAELAEVTRWLASVLAADE